MGHHTHKPMNNRELSSLCEQMAMMLRAGISPAEGILILQESLEDPDGKAILAAVADSFETSGSLHSAFSDVSVFPRYFLDMVEIGERTGGLDEIFSSLASYYDRQEALMATIKSAVTYPCVMIGMMLAVILILIIKVLPIFGRVYEQLGSQMNGIGGALLSFGSWLSRYSLVFLILAAVLTGLVLYLFGTRRGKERLTVIGRRFPLARGIFRLTALCRFADGMAMVLKSGLDPDEGLVLSGQLTDSPELCRKIEECRKKTMEGTSLGTALRETGIFSGLYGRMVEVGILSGSLDQVMEQVADRCAEEANERISRAVSRLEPTLVAVMSILTGMILLSVMLPLMGIMTGIG